MAQSSSLSPLIPDKFDFPQEIQLLSHRFIQVYVEAAKAEQEELFELCGMGYRKALEFLVKDYCISRYPKDSHRITRAQLGYCIDKWITSDDVKLMTKQAVWLGNNETHYEHKHPDCGLHDLKELIGQIQQRMARELV